MLISNASDADWRSLLKARTPSKASIQVSKMELIVFFDKETPPVIEWNRAFFASWLKKNLVTTGSSTHGAEIQERFVTAISDGGLVGCFVVELFTENDVWKRNVDLIAFFKGSSPWCRPWDHRKGKPVSGNPGCRRYLAERFQLSTTGNIQTSHSTTPHQR